MNDFFTTPDPSDLAGLRAEIDAAGRRVLRRIDPGVSGLVISVAIFVLLVTALLPWSREVSGWHVFAALGSWTAPIGVLPMVFSMAALAFGVLISALALTTRLWVLAWLSGIGCALCTVIGLLAVWSLQSSASHQAGPGPKIGLILAELTVLVLAVSWFRLAFSRR